MSQRDDVIAELTRSGMFELVEDHSAGHPRRIYRNAPVSLRDVLIATQAFGDRPFLIYGAERISFAEHFRQVAALAQHLKAAGIGKATGSRSACATIPNGRSASGRCRRSAPSAWRSMPGGRRPNWNTP
jgi:hypothetical protein